MEVRGVDSNSLLVNPAVEGHLSLHIVESDLTSVGARGQNVPELLG